MLKMYWGIKWYDSKINNLYLRKSSTEKFPKLKEVSSLEIISVNYGNIIRVIWKSNLTFLRKIYSVFLFSMYVHYIEIIYLTHFIQL